MEINIFKNLKNKEITIRKLRYEINSIETLTQSVLNRKETKNRDNKVNKKVSSTRANQISNNVNYLYEELYKTIQFFINALVQDMETLHGYKSCLPPIVSIPEYCSLPSSCSMLWKRVQDLCNRNNVDSELRNTVSSKPHNERITRCIQTGNSCTAYCESCYLSTSLIRKLVRTIIIEQRKYCVNTTNVSHLRDNLGLDVFESSQWGVMTKWVAAITKDFTAAMAITAGVQNQCEKLSKLKHKMEREHDMRVTALKDNITLIQIQLEAEKAQNIYFKEQIKNLKVSLERNLIQINEKVQETNGFKETFKTLGDSLGHYKRSFNELRSILESLRLFVQSTLEHESRKLLELKSIITMSLKHVTEDMMAIINIDKNKQLELTCQEKQNETIINRLRNENILLVQQNEDFIKQIQTLEIAMKMEEGKNKNKLKELEEKCVALEKNNKEITYRRLTKQCNDDLPDQKQINTFTGDPIKDMENQRVINKQKIKSLLRENNNLKTIIIKLKERNSGLK